MTQLCYNFLGDKMIQRAFGQRLKELRLQAGLSQITLAKKANLNREQVSKIEKGYANVTLDTVEKLSEALNVGVSVLMDFTSPKMVTSPPKPFVKWAGGKTQIMAELQRQIPKQFNRYYEPFVGGGALLFQLLPKDAIINDINRDLYHAFRCLGNESWFYKLVDELNQHEINNNETYYYDIRNWDREDGFSKLPSYKKAARLIYLNKACYNGLYRVNGEGYFNVPFGKKSKVIAYSRDNLVSIHQYFKTNRIIIKNQDFEKVVASAKKGDFVYFDPPYDTYDEKTTFTTYSKSDFGKEEQKRLAKVFTELSNRGVQVMLSNHNTPFIQELYSSYNIKVIKARRIINSNPLGRGHVEEVIITNY